MAEKRSELDKITENNLEAGNAIGAPSAYSTATLSDKMSENDDFDKDADVVTDTTIIDENQEPEQIKAQIAQTRSEMSETINAIQDKLSFSNISEQVQTQVSEQITGAVETAKTLVYDATVKKAQGFMKTVGEGFNDISEKVSATLPDSEALRKVQKSPVALSIIGLSIGAIVFALTRKGSSETKNQRYQYEYDVENYEEPDGFDDEPRRLQRITDEDVKYQTKADGADFDNETYSANADGKSTIKRATETVGNVASQTYETAGSVANKAVETVGNAASQAYEAVANVAAQTTENVTNLANQAYQQAGNVGSTAKSFAGQTQTKYVQYNDENPLAFGAVALAIGAGIGFALPQTQRENGLVGDSRQRIVRQAQDAIYEAVENAKTTLRDMSQTVKQQASEAGENLQQKFGEVTQEIKVKTGEVIDDAKNKITEVGQNVKDKIEDVGQTVKDKAQEVSETVKETASDLSKTAKDKTDEVTQTVKDKAQEVSQKAKDKTNEVGDKVKDIANKTQDEAKTQNS